MKIEQDVMQVLVQMECEGNVARIPESLGQLERPLYVRVNKVLEACGGKWDKKIRGHLFGGEEAQALIEAAVTTGEVVTRADIGFFPTPPQLAEELASMADVRRYELWLEPSAGLGALADAMFDRGASVVVCERDPKMREGLRSNGTYQVIEGDDFLDIAETMGPEFDGVLMNPPFVKVGRGNHLDHVVAAYETLVPGGKLLSVLPGSIEWREDVRHQDFREWYQARGGEVSKLPEQSFKASGTNVHTCVLRVRKPA